MFDKYGDGVYDTAALEKQIHDLMEDDEIMKKSGIYRYVLSGNLRDLSFRTFDKKQKREAYEHQKDICVHCGKHFELEKWKLIISHHGKMEVLLWLKIARCFVRIAIGLKEENRNLKILEIRNSKYPISFLY
nr:hypothetical protein [Bacteroides caecigallinarum]